MKRENFQPIAESRRRRQSKQDKCTPSLAILFCTINRLTLRNATVLFPHNKKRKRGFISLRDNFQRVIIGTAGRQSRADCCHKPDRNSGQQGGCRMRRFLLLLVSAGLAAMTAGTAQ